MPQRQDNNKMLNILLQTITFYLACDRQNKIFKGSQLAVHFPTLSFLNFEVQYFTKSMKFQIVLKYYLSLHFWAKFPIGFAFKSSLLRKIKLRIKVMWFGGKIWQFFWKIISKRLSINEIIMVYVWYHILCYTYLPKNLLFRLLLNKANKMKKKKIQTIT